MKRIAAGSEIVILQNAQSPFYYFGWPTVCRLPGGALACAASGFRLEHICPFGKGAITYSFDEGATWTLPAVALDTPLDDRDCGLTVFGNGRVMLTSFNNTMAFQTSLAKAKSESVAPEARARAALIEAYADYINLLGCENQYLGSVYAISEDGGFHFGSLHKSPVTCPHGPCRMNDGTVLYIGRRFSSNDSFDDGAKPYIECWRLNAADELEYVSSIENIHDEHGILLSCEPHAIQLPNGKIIVHIRVQRGGEHKVFTIYQSVSEDGGTSFSKPEKLLTTLGGSPAHLFLHSSGALVSVYGYREAPFGIRAMFSGDCGRTWDTNWILYDGGLSGDLGYPATVELTDGSLFTAYYENRNGESRIVGRKWRLPEF